MVVFQVLPKATIHCKDHSLPRSNIDLMKVSFFFWGTDSSWLDQTYCKQVWQVLFINKQEEKGWKERMTRKIFYQDNMLPVKVGVLYSVYPTYSLGLAPVSYTHLDVYKRQVHQIGRSNPISITQSMYVF